MKLQKCLEETEVLERTRKLGRKETLVLEMLCHVQQVIGDGLELKKKFRIICMKITKS